MMSQNRQAARDKQESLTDFAINYKAEQEIDGIQGHLHRSEATAQILVRMQKHYEEQIEEMRTENDKRHQGLLEQIVELKNAIAQQ